VHKKESQICILAEGGELIERSLLETARCEFPPYYPLFLCAVRTEMRLGELFGLQWGDIDFEGRFIEVRRTVKDGGHVFPPKNGKIRRVDLSDQLAGALRALRVERKAETLRRGWPEAPEWVFCSDAGTPLHKSDFEPIWGPRASRASLGAGSDTSSSARS
jgi:integrase